jgi:hypothetical protein
MADILEETGIGDFDTAPVRSLKDDPNVQRALNVRQNSDAMLREEQAHRQALEDNTASIWTGISGAHKYETGTGIAKTMYEDVASYRVEEDFVLKDALQTDEATFRPKAQWEIELIKESKSPEHYEVLKERIKGKRQFMLNAQDLGLLPTMGLQLVAELANVPNYFSFGLSGLQKANKLRRFLTAGAVVGTANVVEEAFINEMYKDRTATDYIVAGTMGMGLGWLGTLGGAAKRADVNMAHHMDEVTDNFGKAHMKDTIDETMDNHNAVPYATDADAVSSLHATIKKTKEDIEAGTLEVKAMNKTVDSVLDENFVPGTKRTIDLESPTVAAVIHAVATGQLPKAKTLLHERIGLVSMSHSMHTSENPFTRWAASKLFEYPESTGRWNDTTAALETATEFHKFSADYTPQFLRTKSAWEVANERSGNAAKSTFDEAAYAFIETGKHVTGATKQMRELVESFEELYIKTNETTYQILKDAGVIEAAGELDPRHLGRGYDGEKFLDAKHKYGEETVLRTIKDAILDGNEFKTAHKKAEADYAKTLDKLQKKYDAEIKARDKANVKEIKDAQKAMDVEIKAINKEIRALKFDKGDISPEGLRKGAKEQRLLAKIADLEAKKKKVKVRKKAVKKPKLERVQYDMPDVDAMAKAMSQALYNRFLHRGTTMSADANLLSSANRSLLLDALRDTNLSDVEIRHIKAVLDTSGRDLKANPTKHQMGITISYKDSQSGLRIFDLMHTDLGSTFSSQTRYWLGRAAGARKGIASEEMFQDLVEQVRRHGIDRDQDGKQIQMDIQRLEMGWKMIKGEPIEPMGQLGFAAMRVVRKLMATASLGKLGIVQAGETGRVMAAAGVKNIWEGIPMIRDMIMDLHDGRLDTAMVRDIQEWAIGKIGDDHYMNHPSMRADDFGYRIKDSERLLDRMSYWQSKASGWHLVHTQQKKTLMNALGHKWYREIADGTMTEVRLKDLGVPFDQLDSLKADMMKHATFNKDGILETLGLGNWSPDNRRTMAYMLHRKSSNAIQDIIAGETPLWMNRGLGKFMSQFRTFSVAAIGKQTVHDWQMYRQGDVEAAKAFQYMIATSTMAVVSRMVFDAAVLPAADRKQYIENNMNLRAITKKVVGYHGQLSPMVDGADMLFGAVMPDAWGHLTGTSQYSNGKGLTGKVPGLGYADRAFKGITGVAGGMLPGESVSKSEWNALVGALPLGSWFGSTAFNKGVINRFAFNEEE